MGFPKTVLITEAGEYWVRHGEDEGEVVSLEVGTVIKRRPFQALTMWLIRSAENEKKRE